VIVVSVSNISSFVDGMAVLGSVVKADVDGRGFVD
jgi:hypothetical protein